MFDELKKGLEAAKANTSESMFGATVVLTLLPTKTNN